MALTPQQATGKKLGGFELVKEVSASSVGATFVAKSPTGQDNVVLTKIHRHVAKSPQLCDAFLSEAKKASRLVHPNIARVIESGTMDGEPFVTHEHHNGDSLAALLRRAGPEGLPMPIAARIVLDLCAAVEAGHHADPPIGHGELGPWCVHVGQDGRARVSGHGVDRALTRFGLHFAKNLDRLPYAAPERVKAMSLTLGPAPIAPDLRADTFSAALIAWELFTRQRLFASRMEAAVIQKVLAGAIPDPKSQRAEISDALAAALTAALARDPAERGTLGALSAAVDEDEVASYEAVSEFASRLVDKSQTRPVNSASTRAFTSVRPPPPVAITTNSSRPPPLAESPSNGAAHPAPAASAADARPRSVPPPPPQRGVKSRAKTLMGFSAVQPTPAAAASAEPLIEEDTTVEIPKPAANGSVAALAQQTFSDEATTMDTDDVLIDVDDAPAAPVPPKPPVRRPPPKPRQHTLIGVEPVNPEMVAALVLDPTPAVPEAQPSAPVATAAEAAKSDTPSPTSKTVVSVYGVERLGPGALVGNPPTVYELLTAVARGGMATVWAARAKGARGLDKLFAVKTILPELSDDADFETMFLDEMRVASRIQHENVARIHSVGGSDGVMFLAMEWVDGETLFGVQQAARSSGGVPLNVLMRMACDICAGLHAAHELTDDSGALLELVHRDVTPANVIVSRSGMVKVVDFGIAKSKGRIHVTRAGSTVKGKTPYLSPEQLGGLAIDRRSDLFSLGALLYVMATGVHPFRGESELKTIENIVLKVPAPLRTLVPDIHPEFEKLVLRLLEKDPKKRFASAAETATELERIELLLEKSATRVDVAAFVERVVGEVFVSREREIIDALRTFDPSDPAVLATSAGPREQPLPPGMAPLSATPSPPAASAAPATTSAGASPFDFDPAATLKTDAFSDSAVEPPPFDLAAASEPAVEKVPPRPVEVAALAPGKATAEATAEAVAEAPAPIEPKASAESLPPPARAPMSPWLRLVLLVVVGIVVGIGVIAMIEALRAPKDTPPPAGTVTATAKAVVTQTAAPTATLTAPPAPTPEPTTTVEPSATATASETALPTATAPATATAPPGKTATARLPGTAPRPPGTGTGKKPPPIKKHNPTGI